MSIRPLNSCESWPISSREVIWILLVRSTSPVPTEWICSMISSIGLASAWEIQRVKIPSRMMATSSTAIMVSTVTRMISEIVSADSW